MFDALLNAGIEINDIENEDGEIVLYLNPGDVNKAKDELEKLISDIEYDLDEVGYYAKEKITLTGEDKELFDRLYNLLDNIEDVSEIYTNVNMD